MSVLVSESAPAAAGLMSTSEALARLAQCRDGDAWSVIVQRYGFAIWRMAQRVTGEASLSDDVVQETLLQIREHAGQFKPPAPGDAEVAARGWIMCIAYRTALGMLRMRQRRSQLDVAASLSRPLEAPSACDSVLNAEELERIRGEIAELPDLLRSAVSLHYYGELSYPELSNALECSEKAARKRVERGVHRLRDRLAAGGMSISFGTLMVVMSPSVKASAAGTAPVASALNAQRLAEWQALLNHPAQPLLVGVAKTGGITLMTKYLIGAAAVALFGISAVQQIQINSLSNDLKSARDEAGRAIALQQKVGALEKQVVESRGESAALKAGLQARDIEFTQLQSKLKKMDESPLGSGGLVFNGKGLQQTIRTMDGKDINVLIKEAQELAKDAVARSKSQTGEKTGEPNSSPKPQIMFSADEIKIIRGTSTNRNGEGTFEFKIEPNQQNEPKGAVQHFIFKENELNNKPEASAVKPPKPPKDANENF